MVWSVPSIWVRRCFNFPTTRYVRSIKRFTSTSQGECGITNIQDDDDFQKRVVENPAPVIVDFHATWCGPCKILAPRLEKVMKSYMNSVLLAKVDVDKVDTVAEKYKVRVVPTVISMKGGKEIDRFEGAEGEEFIKRKIENILTSDQ